MDRTLTPEEALVLTDEVISYSVGCNSCGINSTVELAHDDVTVNFCPICGAKWVP